MFCDIRRTQRPIPDQGLIDLAAAIVRAVVWVEVLADMGRPLACAERLVQEIVS